VFEFMTLWRDRNASIVVLVVVVAAAVVVAKICSETDTDGFVRKTTDVKRIIGKYCEWLEQV